jgi:DNA-binding SARP family transcriptional activator
MGISLYLLGVPRIEREGFTVHVDTRKALALIAYLAVQTGYQSRDTLAALLWVENDHIGARSALRRTLSTLKTALHGVGLLIEREAVALAETDIACDLLAFQAALNDCASHGHPANGVCPRCRAPLTEAAALYKGDFLQGFSLRDSAEFDLWQFQQAEYFRRLYATALERLVNLHTAEGSYETAVHFAQRWLALDTLDDRLRAIYGRLHVQAIKVAILLAALDWSDQDDGEPRPRVRAAHWYRAQQIVEDWRASAHRLLADLGENEEGRLENRILSFLRACGGVATVRNLYRALRSPRKPVMEAIRALEEDGCLERVELPPKPGVKSEAYRLADAPIVAGL